MPKVRCVLAGCVVGISVALGVPGTVFASVSITPTEARQGGAVELTFRVTEDRPGVHTTKVEVQLPAAEPIAEVYPLSDPDWAAKIAYRKVGRPVQAGHGSLTTTVTSGITWFRATGAGARGRTGELRVAMAPLPRAERLAFTVLQTYSDGKVLRWPSTSNGQETGLVLVLTPTAVAPDTATRTSDSSSDSAGTERNGMAQKVVVGFFLGLLLAVGLIGRRLHRGKELVKEEDPLEPTYEDATRPADLESTPPSK
jgi:uncharacterized protein YcnI